MDKCETCKGVDFPEGLSCDCFCGEICEGQPSLYERDPKKVLALVKKIVTSSNYEEAVKILVEKELVVSKAEAKRLFYQIKGVSIKQALTRREVIEAWEGSDTFLDSFVCPDCRDVLLNYSGTLMCPNDQCNNNDWFDELGMRIKHEVCSLPVVEDKEDLE